MISKLLSKFKKSEPDSNTTNLTAALRENKALLQQLLDVQA